MYVCIYIHIYIYIYILLLRRRIYMCICKYIYTHIYIYAHIYQDIFRLVKMVFCICFSLKSTCMAPLCRCITHCSFVV